MRQSKLAPIHVAALVSTGSLVIYAPVYVALHGLHVEAAPLADLTTQIIYQGIVVAIISLVLYGRAVLILGASSGSAFGALVPALSALLAIPLLGEWPPRSGWAGIALISAGVCLASGGPLSLSILRQEDAQSSDRYLCRPGDTVDREHSIFAGRKAPRA
jgi:drug/metabolite transporter (DMT)-like permease